MYSYKFQKSVFDNLSSFQDADRTKIVGYKTCRYPLSGLVGNPHGDNKQVEATDAYNKKYEYPNNIEPLNNNIKGWLYASVQGDDKEPVYHGTYQKFLKCLDAPNYTVFSNTGSAHQYNQEQLNREKVNLTDPDVHVVPLEAPHNDMHLATGGFDPTGNSNLFPPDTSLQYPSAPESDDQKSNDPPPPVGPNGDMVR